MLSGAIGGVIGLAILFFSCGIFCYILGTYLFRDETKDTTKPLVEAWDAKHYYDPLPSVLSPPEILTQPSVYSFKIHNGNHPHAVINPAVLQNYPSGQANMHDNRQIIPSTFQVVSQSQSQSQSQEPPGRGAIGRNSSKVSPQHQDQEPQFNPNKLREMGFVSNGRAGRKSWLS